MILECVWERRRNTDSKWYSKHQESSVSRIEVFQFKNRGIESDKNMSIESRLMEKEVCDYEEITALVEGR